MMDGWRGLEFQCDQPLTSLPKAESWVPLLLQQWASFLGKVKSFSHQISRSEQLPSCSGNCLNMLLISCLHLDLFFHQVILDVRQLCLFMFMQATEETGKKLLWEGRKERMLGKCKCIRASQTHLIYANMIFKLYMNWAFSHWASTLPLLQMN